MALTSVRTYFRTRFEYLGYEEWRDAFNVENIPKTLIDRVYNIESGEITSTASNHQQYKFSCPVIVRIYFKGYNDPVNAIESAYSAAETILADVLSASNRLGTAVYDVVPDIISVLPLSDQNDNSAILELNFTAITFMKF